MRRAILICIVGSCSRWPPAAAATRSPRARPGRTTSARLPPTGDPRSTTIVEPVPEPVRPQPRLRQGSGRRRPRGHGHVPRGGRFARRAGDGGQSGGGRHRRLDDVEHRNDRRRPPRHASSHRRLAAGPARQPRLASGEVQQIGQELQSSLGELEDLDTGELEDALESNDDCAAAAPVRLLGGGPLVRRPRRVRVRQRSIISSCRSGSTSSRMAVTTRSSNSALST